MDGAGNVTKRLIVCTYTVRFNELWDSSFGQVTIAYYLMFGKT